MPVLQHLCQLLYDSQIGTAIRESNVTFPVIESVHVLSITLVFGTIAVLDLRMLGAGAAPYPGEPGRAECASADVDRDSAVSLVTGFLLFWAEAAKVYWNPAFRAKLVLLALVGLNPLIFHTTIYRRVEEWGDHAACFRGGRAPLRLLR